MKTALTLAALAFASLSVVAHARPFDASRDAQTLDVPFSDLNLNNPAGAQAMLNRIKAAAARVCGGKPDLRDMRAAAHYRTCVIGATQNAVAQLDDPRVNALYTGRTEPRTRDAALTQR